MGLYGPPVPLFYDAVAEPLPLFQEKGHGPGHPQVVEGLFAAQGPFVALHQALLPGLALVQPHHQADALQIEVKHGPEGRYPQNQAPKGEPGEDSTVTADADQLRGGLQKGGEEFQDVLLRRVPGPLYGVKGLLGLIGGVSDPGELSQHLFREMAVELLAHPLSAQAVAVGHEEGQEKNASEEQHLPKELPLSGDCGVQEPAPAEEGQRAQEGKEQHGEQIPEHLCPACLEKG